MFFRPPEDDGVADLDFWATEDVRGGGDEDDISVMGLREGEKEERVGEKIVFAMRRLAEMLSLSLDSPRLFGERSTFGSHASRFQCRRSVDMQI